MNLGSVTLGVIDGLLIGVLAIGIVLVYRSDRFLNLAHGQLGAVSALLLGKLAIDWGLSYWIALPVALLVGIAVGVAVDRLIVRRLQAKTSSTVALLLLSVGIGQILQSFVYIKSLAPDPVKMNRTGYPLPFHTRWEFGGVFLGSEHIMILVICPLVVAGLALMLRFSVIGKMIRAAAGNRDEARLSGISPALTSAVTWGIAGGVSALGAILQAPSGGGFNPAMLGPAQLFLSLGAAAFGAFTSIPMALVGGLVLGLASQLTIGVTSNAGTAELVVFALVLVVIFVRGRVLSRAMVGDSGAAEDLPPIRVPTAIRDRFVVRHSRRLAVTGAVVVAAAIPLLPLFKSEGNRFLLAFIVIYAVVGVSVTMVTGWGGQLSLGHFAVVGLGGYIAARLSGHGLGLLTLFAVAGAAGALTLVLVSLPALRVRGFTLAVTTLGFGIVASDWMFRTTWFTASPSGARDVSALPILRALPVPRSQLGVYYVALVTLVVVGLAARALRHSLPGRTMIAVRDDERASAAYGVTPATVKLTTMAVSGAVAGIAGVLWADAWRTVHPDQFPAALSLSLLAVPVIGGLGSVGGAIAAAVAIYFPAEFLTPHLTGLFGAVSASLGFSLGLSGVGMVAVLLSHPTGLAGTVHVVWQRFLDRLAQQISERPQAFESTFALEACDIEVRFGGVRALDGASVQIRKGEIVGLIGPNGAGKSTLLDVISGVQHPRGGSVLLQGRDVSGLAPEMRAGLGLGRTFQAAKLFPGLTVLETIQTALGTRVKVGVLGALSRAPWALRAERATWTEACQIADRMGLTAFADTLTGDLSTGTRRICALATEVAARPTVLLLDEPTAGVAQRETEVFGPLLRRLREDLDCAIVIVEHDMPLLMGLCDRVYAMEAGRVIAEGTPQEIRQNARVIASYLGTDEKAISRSGRVPTPTNGARRPARERPLRAVHHDADVAQSSNGSGHGRRTGTAVSDDPSVDGGGNVR